MRVEVDGLGELEAALAALSGIASSPEFRAATARAADLVAEDARSRASSVGAMQARAVDGLEVAAAGDVVELRYGGSEPFDLGAEFGARRNVRRQTRRGPMVGWNQFLPFRATGYFVGPAVDDAFDDDGIVEVIDEGLEPLFNRLFPS